MIKKGTKVKILSGKDKNKDGEVIEIDRQNNRAKIKGINMVKKHVKTTKEKKGGIISKHESAHHHMIVQGGVMADEAKKELVKWFRLRRKIYP